MNNSSVWNLLSPLRNGGVSVLTSGQEMFGTVIKQGLINKTVTVRVHYRFWNHMYRKYFGRSSNYLVHDEENFCRVGDKVVIRTAGGKISTRKSYFVRNVVKQFPRNDYTVLNPVNSIESKTEFHELYKKFLQDQADKKNQVSNEKEIARQKALEEAMEKFKVFSALDEKEKKKFRKESKEKKRNEAAVLKSKEKFIKKAEEEKEEKIGKKMKEKEKKPRMVQKDRGD